MAILLSTLVAGCTGSNSYTNINNSSVSNGSAHVSKLIIGTTAQSNGNQIFGTDLQDSIDPFTRDGLLMYAEDGTFVPGLADSWESADLKNWTFHLSHNATFQDGTPVTAQDVKFSMDYLIAKDPDLKTRFNIVNSTEVLDNYTVVVHLSTPSYNFLVDVATNLMILPEHVFSKVDNPNTFADSSAMIGIGPFRFVSYDKDAGVVMLKAYDQYRGGKPAIDTVEIRIYKNLDTMMMALQNGEIDTTYVYASGISYYYVPKLLKSGNIKIMMVKNIAVPNALWFHTQKYPYNLTAFRQAVSYAVNYNEVNQLFTAGYGSVPDAGYLPNGSLGYVQTPQLTYNINQSKALLDSLNFKDVDGDGFREYPNGTRFQPELLIADDSDSVRLGQTLQGYLKAVGINAKLKTVDKTTLGSTMKQSKNYEMVISRTTNFGMLAYAGYGSLYIDSRNIGYSMVNDPAYQAEVNQLFNTSDQQHRNQIGADMQQYYAAQQPVIPLYWCDYIQPYDAKFEGWGVDPIDGILSHGTFYNLHTVES